MDQFSFLEVHYVDSQEKDWEQNGYNDLMVKVKQAVTKIKNQEEIPLTWVSIREEIRKWQQEGKKRLELSDFYKLADEVKDPMDVLRWLTQSGVVFYREGLFNDEIILNQDWAIKAIYTLFDREEFYYKALQAQNGKFSGEDLVRIWKNYSEAEQELFISFMLSCELCFETTPQDKERYHTPFRERTFVAPQMLPPQSSEVKKLLALIWRDESPIYIRFEHEFLHYGVIQSFIVRTQKLAKGEAIWKAGILLEAIGQKVQVEAQEQQVDVIASTHSLPLLEKIRKELTELQGKEAREYVSLDGESYVLRSDLAQQAQMGNANVLTKEGKPVPINQFAVFLQHSGWEATGKGMPDLSEIEEVWQAESDSPKDSKLEPKTLPRVYFSYAWGDPESGTGKSLESYVDALYDAIAREQPDYQLLRDKMNIEYGGIISEYMKEMGEGDLILVFISDKYIRSPYCMFELYEIARNCRFDKEEFTQKVLPIPIERLKLHDPRTLEIYYSYISKRLSNPIH